MTATATMPIAAAAAAAPTSGAWRVIEVTTLAGGRSYLVESESGDLLGGVIVAECSAMADARLCSAAPDLLAACEAAFALLTDFASATPATRHETINKALRAMAKARKS